MNIPDPEHLDCNITFPRTKGSEGKMSGKALTVDIYARPKHAINCHCSTCGENKLKRRQVMRSNKAKRLWAERAKRRKAKL